PSRFTDYHAAPGSRISRAERQPQCEGNLVSGLEPGQPSAGPLDGAADCCSGALLHGLRQRLESPAGTTLRAPARVRNPVGAWVITQPANPATSDGELGTDLCRLRGRNCVSRGRRAIPRLVIRGPNVAGG